MSYISTDPIADMLSRIRNATAVNKTSVSLPHSKAKQAVAELLKQYGFISDVTVGQDGARKTLLLSIADNSSSTRITEIVRLSKPGRRLYSGAQEIPVIKRGRGIIIVSTSHGIMSGDEAKKQGVGGELICKVY